MDTGVKIAVILAAAVSGCSMRNSVTVSNETDETILSVSVSVCDQHWTLDSLPPGHSVTWEAVYTRDDHFSVRSDAWNGDFGYVTHGITGETVNITFTEGGIVFEQDTGEGY